MRGVQCGWLGENGTFGVPVDEDEDMTRHRGTTLKEMI
jgi:hypothetical protein